MTAGASVQKNVGPEESRVFADGFPACRMDQQERSNVATI
jgi:hypothetical protein